MRKVFQIGQLPIELGGNYTTGIARVVGELSRYAFGNTEVYLYGTNISDKKASQLESSYTHYKGYRLRPLAIFFRMITHPFNTFKEWRDYRKKGGNNPIRMEFYKDNFIRIIKEIKPDIIHYHGCGLDAMCNANKSFNIPVIYTFHGLMWDGTNSPSPQNLKFRCHEEYYCTLADSYTTLNDKAVKKMLALGVTSNKISIVPNGVDTDKFYFSEEERIKLRVQYNVAPDTFVFVTTGLIIDRKGQFSFLKILESLGIDYQYWIIGKGPDYEPIKDYIAERHIENKVKLLGYIKDSEIYKYHSAADIYAHASTIEGQALSEIEAYTTGLKVIVRKEIYDTVIGDSVKDKETYYIADFDNIDNSSLISWLKENNIMRATRTKYDWSVIAKRYADIYETYRYTK